MVCACACMACLVVKIEEEVGRTEKGNKSFSSFLRINVASSVDGEERVEEGEEKIGEVKLCDPGDEIFLRSADALSPSFFSISRGGGKEDKMMID